MSLFACRRFHALIVGGDDVSYGQRPKDARHWREKMLREVTLDPARTHFLGKLPYDTYKKVLQVPAAHAYLTYPFVLSWSMLEAMASGCLVIGSRTAPVEEVIRDGENGRLVDFFDRGALAEAVVDHIDHRQRSGIHRVRANLDMRERYAVATGNAQYGGLLGDRTKIELAGTKNWADGAVGSSPACSLACRV